MDLDVLARVQRRRQALEALELERSREAALRDQLEEVAAELEGPQVDADAFARLTAEDADLVRATLADMGDQDLDLGEELLSGWPTEEEPLDPQAEREEGLAEIERLRAEIAASRRRQRALQRYLAAVAVGGAERHPTGEDGRISGSGESQG